ncbi:MAG: Panacea domain-containing protein [Patescibacteria group bacterium]|jgi:uncharacterized phage-associated protein
MKTVIEFDHEKATQALNFFARKEGGSISKLKVIKLIWLVDRYHLRKYGRPVTNDTYFAIELGPVGSTVKDLAEYSDFLAEEERTYLDRFLTCNREANTVTSKDEIDRDVLSDSDQEALETIYAHFGKLSQASLVRLSHEYPEWKKYESQLESGGASRVEMKLVDFFSNPSIDNDFFEDSSARIKASQQSFLDNYEIANFWV